MPDASSRELVASESATGETSVFNCRSKLPIQQLKGSDLDFDHGFQLSQ